MSERWTCPMHPEVQSDHAGDCPICGMALERDPVTVATRQYTCPMHPEIVRAEPGDCPICGMALEPMVMSDTEEDTGELDAMTRRFWVSAALSLPLFVYAMGDLIPGRPFESILPAAGNQAVTRAGFKGRHAHR